MMTERQMANLVGLLARYMEDEVEVGAADFYLLSISGLVDDLIENVELPKATRDRLERLGFNL